MKKDWTQQKLEFFFWDVVWCHSVRSNKWWKINTPDCKTQISAKNADFSKRVFLLDRHTFRYIFERCIELRYLWCTSVRVPKQRCQNALLSFYFASLNSDEFFREWALAKKCLTHAEIPPARRFKSNKEIAVHSIGPQIFLPILIWAGILNIAFNSFRWSLVGATK